MEVVTVSLISTFLGLFFGLMSWSFIFGLSCAFLTQVALLLCLFLTRKLFPNTVDSSYQFDMFKSKK